MTRAERLQQRFEIIRETLEQLYGRDRAFGAASAAWLDAIQYMHAQALLAALRQPLRVPNLEEEMKAILQSFHAELCEHLGIKQREAQKLAKSFRQVIDDVCEQKG